MNKLRKALIISVSVMTVLSMSMIAVPFQVGAATASAGDLIKIDGYSPVYYLGSDNKRYVFPNESTYFSWYSDFSSVITLGQDEVESYPLAANVVMRPGTKLVKRPVPTDPKVYAVEPNGVLRHIPDEATAVALYGDNWAQRVVDIPDSFFVNYDTTTGAEVSADTYPAGSLVKYEGSADVYYIDTDGKARKIADEAAFNANRFNWDDVLNAPATMTMPALGADITGADTMADTSQGGNSGTGPVVDPNVGTGLSVALSADTAPSSTLINGQTLASLATFNLTASNDGDIAVKTFKVKRTGISADSDLSAVYLYHDNTRLTENASVSSGYVTWNNVGINVPAGTTYSVTVKSKIAGSSGNVAISVNAASDIVTDGASVSGSFPIVGNSHAMASATLATVALNSTTLPSSTGNVDAGETDYSIWKNTATVGTRKVTLESVRFRQIGSISTSDLQNLRFFVDGVQQGDAMELTTDGYLQFNFATPVTLETGSRVLEVRGNVMDGATRTFSLSLRYDVDMMVKDSEYGVYIAATNIPATSASQTINSGSLTVTKATDSPSGDLVKDASGVTFGTFEFKAYGEPIKIEYLTVGYAATLASGSWGEIRNGALYADGVQIGSTADVVPGGTDFSLGSSLIVTPGTPVMVEFRGDVYDNDGTNTIAADDTITVSLDTYTNGAQRQNSLSFFDVPTSSLDANALTVKTGSMTLSKYATYGNQTIVVPQTAYKLGSFVLTGNATEAINLNTISLSFTASGTFSTADLSDVYLDFDQDGAADSSIKSTVTTGTSTWSVTKELAVSESMHIDVYASVGSSVSNVDSIIANLAVSGITNQSNTTVNGYAIGQTITNGVASISIAKDSSSADTAVLKGGSATAVEAATYKVTTVNDAYTISQLVFKFSGTNAATAISSVELYSDGTYIGAVPVNGTSAAFDGLTITVPANDSSLLLSVKLVLGSIGTGAGATGANVQVTLDSYKAAPDSTGTISEDTSDVAANALYVYKAIPTITAQALPSTVLAAGTKTLAKFTVGSDGEIDWKKIVLDYTTSGSFTFSNIKLYEGSTEVAGTAATSSTQITFVATNIQSVSSETTYELKATIGGTLASDNYITTTFAQPSSFASPAAYATVAATTASFVWSDKAINGHDLTTADWDNDYLIKNLALDSQTLTK